MDESLIVAAAVLPAAAEHGHGLLWALYVLHCILCDHEENQD
jgi:hypothetical protein